MQLRRLFESLRIADSVRSLTEASDTDLRRTLLDFAAIVNPEYWTLVGGLAVGLRARPRGTNDVDVVLAANISIDEVVELTSTKFALSKTGRLTHRETGLDLDLLTPTTVPVSRRTLDAVLQASDRSEVNGVIVPVTSRDGLVALKCISQRRQDAADVEAVLRAGGPVNLNPFFLSAQQTRFYEDIESDVI